MTFGVPGAKRHRKPKENSLSKSMSEQVRTIRLANALCVLLAFATISTLGMPTASASSNGTSLIRNWAQGQCLDGNSAGQVYMSTCQAGNPYQNWTEIHSTRPGAYANEYMLYSQGTHRCLDSNANLPGAVYTLPCTHGDKNQYWLDGDRGGNVHNFFDLATNFELAVSTNRQLYTTNRRGAGVEDWKRGL